MTHDFCEDPNCSTPYCKGCEDDRGERTRAGEALQGVCKDCGNGTLNNDLNPAFSEDGDELHCMACSSRHLDIL
jgi:hypothetical protein